MRMAMFFSSDDSDYETHPTVAVRRDDDGDFYVILTDNDGTEFALCLTPQQYRDFARYISRSKATLVGEKQTSCTLGNPPSAVTA